MMTFESPLRLSDVDAPDELRRACELANRATREDDPDGSLATCILTSQALRAYLGQRAELVRVAAAVYAADRDNGGVAVGSYGDGTRRKATAPGMWRGHLVVLADGYLLDATIDQVNGGLRNVAPIRPHVVPVPGWWESGRPAFYVDDDQTIIRYAKYFPQNGWRSAPDSRPSHWKPVLEIMQRRGNLRLVKKAAP
jgi:hypothetical protein